jgi:hypothetical protein
MMKNQEKQFYQHEISKLSKEEQKREIIESISIINGHAEDLIKYSSGMLQLIESLPINELILNDDCIRFYDLLGLEIYRSKRYFKQFEIKLKVYADPKNIKQ